MTTWQFNCGGNSGLSGWINDTSQDQTTFTNAADSTGGTSTVDCVMPSWDSANSDGVSHADLPSQVYGTYLKHWGGSRTIQLLDLDNTKTYTITLYSTAPGSVSNDWTVASGFSAPGTSPSTKSLTRGGKQTWTGVAPSGGNIVIYGPSTSPGSDVTLSAMILSDGAVAATRRRSFVALIS